LSLAEPTGESWPLYGRRLAPAYPFIEAEVRYAVKHEYALTAVDAIARRMRLSFLDAQATLDALPRVVDIMGEELGWSLDRKTKEIERAGAYLLSMGLQPGTTLPEAQPSSLIERVSGALSTGLGLRTPTKVSPSSSKPASFSRAQFEGGELEILKSAFARVAKVDRLPLTEVVSLVHELPGYKSITAKEAEYVLTETGLSNRPDVEFDEFVEICAGLKEVAIAPAPRSSPKSERRRIPVERTGGGV
jgi:glycerol-3-phosphate dehydrogenase